MENCPSASPTQHTTVRGVLETGIARESPQNRQAIKLQWSIGNCYPRAEHSLLPEGDFLHPLALIPIVSSDLWQVSITSEAATLGKQVTCHGIKARLDSEVKEELLCSSWLQWHEPLNPVALMMQECGEIKVINQEIMIFKLQILENKMCPFPKKCKLLFLRAPESLKAAGFYRADTHSSWFGESTLPLLLSWLVECIACL